MPERQTSAFDERITSERVILRDYINNNLDLPTNVLTIGQATLKNPVSEEIVGTYRGLDQRKCVTADMDVIKKLAEKSKLIPSFLVAGPSQLLYHDPQSVKAAIITSGGLAPGLNCAVHSIVTRHWNTYSINKAKRGGVFGIRNGFIGLCSSPPDMVMLEPNETEGWLDRGGSILGARRVTEDDLATTITKNMTRHDIDILYVIGGDGSLKVAHQIAKLAKTISVVGVPKTMDNDVLWVWQSFGFNTASEKATEVVNTMHSEAESTRRVCIIELFGAESGFIAANAALASGHVDLVMVPESFMALPKENYNKLLLRYVEHLVVRKKEKAHAVVVLAEGVGELLKQREISLEGTQITGKDFAGQFRIFLQGRLKERIGQPVDVFVNQPRHNIRAIPANAYDRTYCQRLGALAVDNALAGYTDFMISQWLTEYVLVPLELVTKEQKSIPPCGMFWKQVISSTGQPR
jgi:6-phosphofructokinase 1